MDLSKVCSCLNNEAQIDGVINSGGQIQSTVDSARQINSELGMLNLVTADYLGGETDNIIVNVDNTSRIITATLKAIQYDSKLNFPNVGSSNLIYVDVEDSASYRWDNTTLSYVCIGRDFEQIEVITGGGA